MAVRACSVSPLRWGGTSLRRTDDVIEETSPVAGTDGITEWEAMMKKRSIGRSRSNSPPPPPTDHVSRLRARTVMRHRAVAFIPPPPRITCTPTPTPTATPSQTPPSTTPATTPPRKRPVVSSPGTLSSASSSATSITFPPARLETSRGREGKGRGEGGGGAATEGLRVDTSRPPVPAFSSSFTPPRGTPPPTTAETAAATVAPGAAAAAALVCVASAGGKDKSRQPPRASGDRRAGPFAGQGIPFSGGKGVDGETGECAAVAAVCRRRRGAAGWIEARQPEDGQGRVQQDGAPDQVVSSIESEVAGMLDESRGTLRLSRDGLGDERVPALSLEGLKDAYRTGRASLTSWTTAGVFNRGRKTPVDDSLIEVEQGRLGVLTSTDVYLFHYKEIQPPSPSSSIPAHSADVGEEADQGDAEMDVFYLWLGREAGAEACSAARAQGKRLLEQQWPLTTQTPLLEVEQGCEPALFLALFSYMLPPLVAVVLQGQNETPNIRVLELQESPCLHGSGIVVAVEGPSSASLLAKHGPLPDRSYICLVRPRRSRGGSASERGGTFDEGYYWHGMGETPAVEEVGILLCQQVDRMFPSPPITDCGKRKGGGRKRRGGGGGGFGGGMMRGYVADVKVGLPVPDGFWACVRPERSVSSSFFASGGRWLPLQDLRPERRSRPVRVFGVCAGSQNARKSFVWEVTAGGMPSQMRLSPSLSHVVDAGGSHVYVWHGNGSSSDGRRLAYRVASSYATECGVSVEEVDAGSEPVGLLDCFIGWNQALVEPPPMPSLSPGRKRSQLESSADLSPLTTPTRTASGGGRSSAARAASSGSTSSSLGPRLTPPGQRTPPFSVNSPPSLKQLASGVCSPPRRRRAAAAAAAATAAIAAAAAAAAAAKSSLSGSQGCATPPKNARPVAQHSVPRYGACSAGNDGRVASPPSLPGSTPCKGAVTPNRTTSLNGPSVAVLPTPGANGSSSDALHGPDDEPSSSSGGAYPSSESDSGGKAFDGFDQGGGVSCESGFRGDQDSRGVTFECAGGQGEGNAVKDGCERQRSPGGAGGGDGSVGTGGGGSDQGGHDDNEGSGEREDKAGGEGRMGGGGAGGGGGGDDGDDDDDDDDFRRTRNRGGSGAVKEKHQEEAHDRDGDESGESDADEESDTFLRLSDVRFCEPAGIRRNSGGNAELSSSMCSKANDASIVGRSSSGGVETCGVLSRHLSDFFRSPFALDSTSKQQLSSTQTIPDVRAGPRLFDSVKSGGADDSVSFRTRDSGSLFGSNDELVTAFSSAIGNAPEIPASVMINFAASPRYSAPSPADVATEVPTDLSDPLGSVSLLRSDDTKGAMTEDDAELVAESSDCSEPAAESALQGSALSHESRTPTAPPTAPAACESRATEGAEEDKQKAELVGSRDRPESTGEDSCGAESEEEWLCHSTGDASVVPWSGKQADSSERARLIQAEPVLDPSHDRRAIQNDICKKTGETPVSTKVQDREERGDDPVAVFGDDWSGLNEDGSWRTEYARRAAGEAGAAEAERRRLAKVKADESWRSDARKGGGTGCHGAQDFRRESSSFTRLTGNVRDKLSMFEGVPSSKTGRETTGNRSSVGALHGRGLVSAWAKKSTNYATPAAAFGKDSKSPSNIWNDDTSRVSRLADKRGSPQRALMDDSDDQDEFLWKAGPAPCRLKGRPSLNLIRNGQVRIMSKALLMSCPESGDNDVAGSSNEGNTGIASKCSVESSEEPPAPSTPSSPPPPRVSRSPSPARASPGNASGNRRPLPEPRIPHGISDDRRPAAPKGNYWLAKAGLTRKRNDGASTARAPATPSRGGGACGEAGETFTSPVTHTRDRVAAGFAAAARVNDATDASRTGRDGRPATSVGVWAKLHRRLDEERKSMGEEGRPDTLPPGVSSG